MVCSLGRPSAVGRSTAIGPSTMRFLMDSVLMVNGEASTSVAVSDVVALMSSPGSVVDGGCQESRSRTMAMPWPPPTHMVSSPN